MSGRRPATRITAEDADERPGSAFNELVMLPTFAPQIARSEYLTPYQPGTPIPYPQPRSQQMREGVLTVAPAALHSPSAPSLSQVTENEFDDAEPEAESAEPETDGTSARTFDVSIHTNKTLPPVLAANGRSYKPAPKAASETFLCSEPAPVLDLSRTKFINDYVFDALNAKGIYVAGSNGPGIKCFWKGFAEKDAPTVYTDAGWDAIVRKLAKTRVSTVEDFHVRIDITDAGLVSYRASNNPLAGTISELSAPNYGAPATPPMPMGTQVPNVAGCTERQRAVGAMANAVRNFRQCDNTTHTTACFVDKDDVHWPLTRFRENQFVDYLLADSSRTAQDDVPDHLLDVWRGGQSSGRPRGRTGPGRASGFEGADFPAFFAQGMGMMTGAMASAITSAVTRTPSGTPGPSTPSSSGASTPTHKRRLPFLDSSPAPSQPRSSPPPEVEDELSSCLEKFAKRRKISDDVVAKARDGLSDHGYYPDALAALDTSRIQELTGFSEGHSEGLKRFAEDYSKKVEGKRERRRL
ncbi:hypothetical protein V5O48_015690 [Marasmius crinis-equi]|uniref:Uncharacterized protein n=1 Tax=Marasmius crinis-equi TaxID=585013 RepID=A0ABR3ETW6_9AGAR